MFIFEIDDAGQIWIPCNQSACHATALVSQELSDTIIKHLQFFRITKTYSIFGIEEYCWTGLWRIFKVEELANLRLGKIAGGKRDVIEHPGGMRIDLCVLDGFRRNIRCDNRGDFPFLLFTRLDEHILENQFGGNAKSLTRCGLGRLFARDDLIISL